ncbi:unnamed protein product [Echinostoma caproni]|uniref:MORN repeat-containing protein 5 n=1 Tax=Echinostoma caproni TaxID=27848 RepID=A0A183ANU9_9TREM|nr:unnamed protein product [Echinostoma caproni]
MFGRFVFPNGDYYEGHYTQSRQGIVRNGEGKYLGAFRDAFKPPEPTEVISEKSKSNLDWDKDASSKREPENYLGKFNYLCYSGSWVSDKIEGYGFVLYPNGEKYEGQFKENRMHGEGTYTWPDGFILKGTFLNNRLAPQSELSLIDPSEHEWTGKWNGDNVIHLKSGGESNIQTRIIQTRLALKLTSL